MRAFWYSELGPADRVLQTGEMEAPTPDAGEVLVRLATSGVNPVDVKRRAGGRGGMSAAKVIPHFDGAGVIESVGEGVSASRVGERVWVYEAQWQRPFGTAAELVAIPAQRVVPLPENVSFAEGACLGIPAMTAHHAVFEDGSVSGKTVLVTGGAGAVGSYAVQFAKLGGAEVITTVSTDEKAEWANVVGADHVIRYKTEDVAAEVKEITKGDGVDRIVEVEFGGNLAASLDVLEPNGVIATYASEAVHEPSLPFYSFLYKNVTVRFQVVFLMSGEAKRQAIDDITRWLASGSLKHRIAECFPLQRAAAAHEAVEGGTFGKVILEIG